VPEWLIIFGFNSPLSQEISFDPTKTEGLRLTIRMLARFWSVVLLQFKSKLQKSINQIFDRFV
jgi:hypothetical protein